MILLVDTNPILARKLIGESFPKGGAGRVQSDELNAAGCGAHMAKFARDMNEGARLLVFLGGLAGERYAKILRQEGIIVEAELLRDESQEQLILEEKYKETTIYTSQPRLTREDIDDFYERYVKEIVASDAVVIGKGSRLKEPEEMKIPLVRYARSKSKPVIILSDEDDDHDAIKEAKPFGLIIDQSALSKIMGKNMQFLGEIATAIQKLYAEEIPLILVTGSGKGNLLYCRGDYYYAKNNEAREYFDAHSAAVAMAAGIVRKYDAPTLLKLAAAAAHSVKETDFALIKSDMNKINIQQMEV